MKSALFFTTAFILLSFITWAQAPSELNYQAVVRNSSGQPLDSAAISVTFSILDGSPTGPSVYGETQSLMTNRFGLINTQIGLNGNLSTINWAGGTKYLQVQVQVGGGSLTDMGTTQLVSVPYSLYAATAANAASINGTTDYVAKFSPNGTSLGNSLIYDNGAAVGIGTTSPASLFEVDDTTPGYDAITGVSSGSVNGLVWGQGSGAIAGVYGEAGFGTTQYQAGVYGFMAGSGKNSAGVLGAYATNVWAALGYVDANSGHWGIWDTGNAYFNGNVGINTPAVPTYPLQVSSKVANAIYGTTDTISNWGSLTGYDIVPNENGVLPVASISGEYINPTGTTYDGVGVLGLAVQTYPQYGAGGVFLGGWYGIYAATKNHSGAYGVYALADSVNGAAVYAVGAGTTQYGVYAEIGSSSNWAGYFNGNVYATGTITQLSDAALKKNINNYSDALSSVMQLTPKTYDFKTDDTHGLRVPAGKQYGFLAQDLEKVFPELVQNTTQMVNNPKDRSDRSLDYHFKSVNYISLIPILTKAIQEQEQTIEQLQKEVEQLKSK